MKFSVLMSLYIKEKSDFFDLAMKSIYEQTLLPSEVVIVHDGPLTNDLYETISFWKQKLPVVEVILDKNEGLGNALNAGLNKCKHELIARVDTDDINVHFRFEKQTEYMVRNKDVALCGGHISEFLDEPAVIKGHRKVPVGSKLQSYFNRRNPINHMTVMFRKSSILAVGGYKDLCFMEDYYLWLRLHANDFKLVNLDETLVLARVGNGMLERRRGFIYFKSELKMLSKIIKLGVCRKPSTMIFFLCRALLRIVPSRILSFAYRKTRHDNSHLLNN